MKSFSLLVLVGIAMTSLVSLPLINGLSNAEWGTPCESKWPLAYTNSIPLKDNSTFLGNYKGK